LVDGIEEYFKPSAEENRKEIVQDRMEWRDVIVAVKTFNE